MLRFLFDTDHLTLYDHQHPVVLQRFLGHLPGSVGVTIVTAEEALRGRLAVVSKAAPGTARIQAYDRLASTLHLLNQFPILCSDQPAEDLFQHLRGLKLRIGSQDLRIAAIALAHQLVLVTRNQHDFGRVPGLVLEDWSI